MKYFLICGALLAGSVRGQLSQTGGSDGAAPLLCGDSQQASASSQGTAQVIAAATGKAIRVCGLAINSDGSTTVQLVQGKGANCNSGRLNLTPAFKLTNGTTVTLGGSVGQILKLTSGNALCFTTTSNPDVGVLIVYTQQ